jgi:hypothetical protein
LNVKTAENIEKSKSNHQKPNRLKENSRPRFFGKSKGRKTQKKQDW